MSQSNGAEVFRVCAVSVDRWDVYQEPRGWPVASFTDKASALNYAMCLARGRIAWHLLLRSSDQTLSSHVNANDDTTSRH
jgi:hypothetical protein